MGLPIDHATLLRRHDFVIPANTGLDERERLLLVRYGRWLEGLSSGVLQALTPEQEHFVRVAQGNDAPETEIESVWVKISSSPAPSGLTKNPPSRCIGPLEVADRVARLAAAKRSATALQSEYEQKRALVLEQVRAQLEAVESEYGERLRAANEEVSLLEDEVKDAVREVGESVKQKGIHAIYMRGRVTWDSRALSGYAESHPELLEFRRVGTPSVSIRYKAVE